MTIKKKFLYVREKIQARVNRREVPDPTPLHIPGEARPLNIREEMQRFIKGEVSRAVSFAADSQHGSFEEEDDFNIPDDDSDLTSPYTVHELFPEGDTYALESKQDEKEDKQRQDPGKEPGPGAVPTEEGETATQKPPSSLQA